MALQLRWASSVAERQSARRRLGGYDLAWKLVGANDYKAWSVDSNGNFVNEALGPVPGRNLSLQVLELTFNQDLNGDGRIEPPHTDLARRTWSAEDHHRAKRTGEDGGALAKHPVRCPFQKLRHRVDHVVMTAARERQQLVKQV